MPKMETVSPAVVEKTNERKDEKIQKR